MVQILTNAFYSRLCAGEVGRAERQEKRRTLLEEAGHLISAEQETLFFRIKVDTKLPARFNKNDHHKYVNMSIHISVIMCLMEV